MTDAVTMTWTPQRSDLIEAHEARRYDLGLRRREVVSSVVMLAAGGVIAGFGHPYAAAVCVIYAVLVLFPQMARLSSFLSIRRFWAMHPTLGLPVECIFNDQGVRYRSNGQETLHPWAGFICWVDAANVLVLCNSTRRKGAYLPLAKRGAADDQQLTLVKTRLIERLGEPAARR